MNKITVLGRLTTDVEMRETTSGIEYCKFRLASRGKTRDKDGNYSTDFFLCTAWREKAELLQKHTKKGSQIMAVGAMQSRQYTGDDGEKRTIWELNVEDFEFAGTVESDGEAKKKGVKKTSDIMSIDELPPAEDEYDDLPF